MPFATKTAGWLAIGVGVGHSVLAPAMRRREWGDVRRRGWHRAISVEPGPEQLPHAEAFWFGPASFGVPWALFGGAVLAADRVGDTLPASLGVATTVWGVAMTRLLPDSPAWSMPAVGLLLLAAARDSS